MSNVKLSTEKINESSLFNEFIDHYAFTTQIDLKTKLGKGAFGEVWIGDYAVYIGDQDKSNKDVAIKRAPWVVSSKVYCDSEKTPTCES